MDNKLIGVTIGATIVILMVATMLVPIVSDIGGNAHPEYENGSIYATEISDDDVSIVYTASSLTVDGVSIEDYALSPIFASDTMFIDCIGSTCTIMCVRSGSGQTFATVTAFSGTVDASEKTVTFSSISYGDSATATDISVDAYSWAYVVSNDGDYNAVRITAAATNYYASSEDEIIGGIYASGSLYTTIGTTVYADGVETSDATVTIDSESVDAVDGVIVFGLDSSSDSAIILSYGSSSTAPIGLFILPAVVSGDAENQSYYLVVAVIPIMVLLVVLMYVGRNAVWKD